MSKDIENDINKEKIKSNVTEKIRELVDKNRAAALGLAVFMVLSTATAGCSNMKNAEEEEEDDSYYIGSGSSVSGGGGGFHSGGYFYSSGSSYRTGSWSKQTYGYSGSGKSYSSSKGASIGG